MMNGAGSPKKAAGILSGLKQKTVENTKYNMYTMDGRSYITSKRKLHGQNVNTAD